MNGAAGVEDTANPPPGHCDDHHVCRCVRADELARMGRTAEALGVHTARAPVVCRLTWLKWARS